MQILITGITGLLGSFLAKHFLEQNHQVIGLIRKKADTKLITAILPQIKIVEGDINDIFAVNEAVKQADWVIHAAGLVSYRPADRQLLHKINVEGTTNIVNACLEHSTQKLLFVSSIAAVGKKPNQNSQTITEQNDWNDESATSNYALSKYLAELELWRGIAEGLNAVIVNPSIILGEADWHKTSTRLFKYVYDNNKFYTNGNINYIDVQDLVLIIDKLLISDISSERFIASAGSISIIDFFRKIALNFKKKAPNILLGPVAIAILWRFEHARGLLLGTNPLITKETAESAKKNHNFSSKKLLESINFEFKTLDDSLNRICKNLLQKND